MIKPEYSRIDAVEMGSDAEGKTEDISAEAATFYFDAGWS